MNGNRANGAATQAVWEQESVQVGVAIFLLAMATLPLLLLALFASVTSLASGPFAAFILWATTNPGAAPQIFAYVALLLSTVLGAKLISLFKFKQGRRTVITRWGMAFLAYALVCLIAAVLFGYRIEAAGVRRELLPLVGGGGDVADLQYVASAKQYAGWVTGSMLSLAASVLGLPAPSRPE